MNHLTAKYGEIQFSDADVVNLTDISMGSNPHNVRPFLLHDHGFTLAIVFADCLGDALDIAADAGKLDAFRLQPEREADYPDGEGIDYLGSHCEAYDIQNVDSIELPNPPLSFTALYSAHQKETP